jgi:radical SAM protein with 4Fe4S-binding SPASM domain
VGLMSFTAKIVSGMARPLGLGPKAAELVIRLGARRATARVPDSPRLIWVEPTSACNLRCIMCDRKAVESRKTGVMDFEIYTRIIDEAAAMGASEIAMGLGGEPLIHPRLPEMIKYARSKGLSVSFNTNANLLDEAKARAILESGLDKIVFSVDGACQETYEKIRVGGNFATVTENLKRFLALKKEMGLDKPRTVFQTIIMKGTENEIGTVIDTWHPLVDEVSVAAVAEYGDVGGVSLVRRNRKSPRIPCPLLWFSLSVQWNGDVTVCCNDMGGELVIGNITRDSLKDLWQSDRLNTMRRVLRKGEKGRIPRCDRCEAINVDLIRRKKALVAGVADRAGGKKITRTIE